MRCFIYCATNMRPDIAYTRWACRAMNRPTQELVWDAARVLASLSQPVDLGLTYKRDDTPHTSVYGMPDSDWGVKHSTSGNVFMLNQAPISWSSKRQTSQWRCRPRGEDRGRLEAAKEGMYLSRLASELGLHNHEPLDRGVMDNKEGIDVAYNQTRVDRVERRHFTIHEAVEDHKIRVPFVRPARTIWLISSRRLCPRSRSFPCATIQQDPINVPDRACGRRPAAGYHTAHRTSLIVV